MTQEAGLSLHLSDSSQVQLYKLFPHITGTCNSVLHGRLGNSQNFPIIILCWFVIMLLYTTRYFLKTTGETKEDGLGCVDNISHGKDRYDVKKLCPIRLSHILEHSGFSSIGCCDVGQI